MLWIITTGTESVVFDVNEIDTFIANKKCEKKKNPAKVKILHNGFRNDIESILHLIKERSKNKHETFKFWYFKDDKIPPSLLAINTNKKRKLSDNDIFKDHQHNKDI